MSDPRPGQREAGFQGREARPRQTPLASAPKDAVPTPLNRDVEAIKSVFGLTVFGHTLFRIIVMAAQRGRLTFP